MGYPFYALPMQLYLNLEDILNENGIKASDITFATDCESTYAKGSALGIDPHSSKVVLITLNDSHLELYCSTQGLPNHFDSIATLGPADSKKNRDILKKIDPILIAYGAEFFG